MRVWFAALAVMAAGEARAQAVDDGTFCATLRLLIDAASERRPFGSLGPQQAARAADGLGFDACRLEPGRYARLVCTRMANLHHAAGPAPEVRIARCLPEALRMAEPKGSRSTGFRLGTLALHVERPPRFIRLTVLILPVER